MTMHSRPNVDPLRPGDPRLLGSYRVLGRLGRGGMGTVYLAEDGTGRRVAIKVINTELADEPVFRERFRREVESASKVRRFCTAPVIDAQLDQDPVYSVTEYIDGPNLQDVVSARGPLPGSDLEGLAVGVATALTAIHGAGVVHRDLKPSNVLLSATGPRVIDFGIARALDTMSNSTRTGQVVGTPGYLAPELLRGEEITAATDIFSWGCVVAFASTGRSPFSGKTTPEIMYKVVHHSPVLDGMDEGLRALVEQALDKDQRNRPTAQQLLARLTGTEDAGASSETIRATWPTVAPTLADMSGPPSPAPTASAPQTPGRVVPGASAPDRRRLIALGGAAVAAVLVAGALLWAVLPGSHGDSPPTITKTFVPKDNFASITSGWPNDQYSCGHYQDDAYLITVRNYDTEINCEAPVQDVAPTNCYLADVRVKLLNSPANDRWSAGIYFLKNGSNRYDLTLFPDGTARLLKVTENLGREVKRGKISDFKKQGFNRIQARLDLTGPTTRMKLWVNGSELMEFDDSDSPLRTGKTGIIVDRPFESASRVDTSAIFDDYTLGQVGT